MAEAGRPGGAGDDDGIVAPEDGRLRVLLSRARTIAVVGLSSDPDRPSNDVASYMQRRGYRIIPVNPFETEVLGERAHPSLIDVPERVDVVNVFRRPQHTPEVAREAVAIGARMLWLQVGVVND
jgi:uncharacterized protein